MHKGLAILVCCLSYTSRTSAQVLRNPYPTTLDTSIATKTATTTSNPIITSFNWFHTTTLNPNLPIPTLRGRLMSVDQFGFTKYRVTCAAKDVTAGCTYADFTVSVSGTSQMYYESESPKRSVGCEITGTTAAVCSSRNHGEEVKDTVTKTYNPPDFPGFYPVLITADPVPPRLTFQQDVYIHERIEPDPPKSSASRQTHNLICLMVLSSLISFLIAEVF